MFHSYFEISLLKFAMVAALLVVIGLTETVSWSQDLDLSIDEEQPVLTEDDPLGLSLLRDDYWLTANDNPAYYGLLNKAQEASPDELEKEAKAFVKARRETSRISTFVDIIRNTKEFRGQPIQLKGHVLQTIEYEADENPYGIKHLYEATLFTEDSQSHPATVVFLEKPDNLPVGGGMVDGVTVNGYFLKTYLYPSSDNETRKAPLVLAKTVNVRTPKTVALPTETNPYIYWVLGGGLVLLAIIVIFVQRSDRKRMLENQKKRLAEEQPIFDEKVPVEA